jgi:putative ABC transport system permease protein
MSELALLGRRVRFTVCGSVQTPEYIYLMPEGSIMPDDKNYGVAYVPLDVLETLLGRQDEASDVSFAFEGGVVYEDVEKALKTALAPSGLIRLIPRADQASHSMLDQEIEGMRSMVGVVPFLFLMVGALIMSVVIKRLVDQQHAQIGLMKAYGYSGREVLGHYAIYGVVIGSLASVIGGALGAMVSGYMAALYSAYFYMPGISGSFSFTNVLKLSFMALLFGAGASVYGARDVLKLTAAEAMHPPAPPSGKPILLERLQGFWRMLGTTTQLSLRNLFRSRLRSVLTWIGLTICYALIAAVFAFSPMVDLMMTENFTEVQRYDLKAGLAEMADARALESALSHMQGVATVEAVLETQLTLRKGALEKDATLLALPTGGTLYRLFDDRSTPVSVPEEGVAITYRMAENLGVEPGDRILLDIPYPDKEVYVPVCALCEQYTSNYVVIDRAYLASLLHMPQYATSAMIKMAPGDVSVVDELMERLNSASNITSVMSIAQVQQNMS